MSYIQELSDQFRAFPRTVKLFYATDILFGLAQAIWSTLFNLHMLAVGYTADHIGQIQSVAALLMALLAIPVGLASDRLGRRWIYVAGSILFGLPYLVIPWFTSFGVIVAAMLVFTVGNCLMFVNESPLLAGEVGSDKRASVFSFMMINFFIWNTLGIQLAGFLSGWLPAGPLTQYQWPLVIAGVCALASGVSRVFLPFKEMPVNRRRLNLRPTRSTVMIGLTSLLAGAFSMIMFGFNNVILAQRLHMNTETIATVMTISGVVGWLGSLAVPWTSRRFGDLKAYVFLVGLQGLLFFFMGAVSVPALFLTGWWARTVLGTMQMSVWSAFAMGVTPEEERATASSYSVVGRNLGSAVAAKFLGVLLAAGAYGWAFALSGTIALAAGAFALLAFRRPGLFEAEAKGA